MISIGDSARGLHGSYKKIDITYPNFFEETIASPIALTTSEQAVLSITVTAEMLPVFSESVDVQYVCMPIIGGRNTSGGSVTVHQKVYINGVSRSVDTTLSVVNNNYFTYTFYNYLPLVVGDVFEVRQWLTATASNVNVNLRAYCFYFTRLKATKDNALLADVSFVWGGAYPILTVGNPQQGSSGGYCPQHDNTNLLQPKVDSVVPFLLAGSTGGIVKNSYCDVSSSCVGYSDATYCPRHLIGGKVSSISYREVAIK
jgi:hypothetical protein